MKIFGKKRRNTYEYCSNKIEATAKSTFKPLDVDVVYCIIDHEVHVMQRLKWFKLTPQMFADGMGISIFEANDIIGFKKEESVLDETKIEEFLNKSVEVDTTLVQEVIEDEVPQEEELEEPQTLEAEEHETPDVEEPETSEVEVGEPETPEVEVEEPGKEALVESVKEQFEESAKTAIKDVLNPKTFSDEPNEELINLKEENAKLLAKVQKYERLFGKIIDKTESK